MSHMATNWAIEQRGLKPATKIVLWRLCDRHNPDLGCFPSQERLAHDCEMSRSTLNVHLSLLEEMGLIRREQQTDPETRKQKPTRYRFAFEFEAGQDAENGGNSVSGFRTREGGEPVSGNDEKPCPENGQSRVRIPDTNPVREPVREPVRDSLSPAAPVSRGEREAGCDREKVERAFKAFGPTWPTWISDSEDVARKAWYGLTPEERQHAVARKQDYLDAERAAGRTHTCALSKYLAEKRWRKLPEPKPGPTDGVVALKPFGKDWMAHRLWLLANGPKRQWVPGPMQQSMLDKGHDLSAERRKAEHWLVTRLDADAEQQRTVALREPGQRLGDPETFVSIAVDSDAWHAWHQWHEDRDWPWIDPPSHVRFVWMPAARPDEWADAPVGAPADGMEAAQ